MAQPLLVEVSVPGRERGVGVSDNLRAITALDSRNGSYSAAPRSWRASGPERCLAHLRAGNTGATSTASRIVQIVRERPLERRIWTARTYEPPIARLRALWGGFPRGSSSLPGRTSSVQSSRLERAAPPRRGRQDGRESPLAMRSVQLGVVPHQAAVDGASAARR